MPFVRVSRDKRGYETIYLVHTSQRRGRSSATRVLYVFRTPPGVKVGRDPFDAEVRRTLEAQNPGVEFDWPHLSNIPAPPPDVEHWRERRRAEKAARQARKAEEAEEPSDAEGASEGDAAAEADGARHEAEHPSAAASGAGDVALEAAPVAGAVTPVEGAPAGRSGTRRRRRRGTRKRLEPGGAQAAPAEPAGSTDHTPRAAGSGDPGDPGDNGEDVA